MNHLIHFILIYGIKLLTSILSFIIFFIVAWNFRYLPVFDYNPIDHFIHYFLQQLLSSILWTGLFYCLLLFVKMNTSLVLRIFLFACIATLAEDVVYFLAVHFQGNWKSQFLLPLIGMVIFCPLFLFLFVKLGMKKKMEFFINNKAK